MATDTYGIDLSDRREVQYGDLTLQIGPLPFGKGPALASRYDASWSAYRARLAELHPDFMAAVAAARTPEERKALATPDGPELEEAIQAQAGERILAAAEIVRWGLKGWSAAKPLAFEETAFGGKRYQVISGPQLNALSRLAGGAFLIDLANAILAAERIEERDVLGFKAPSGS